jgi:TonB-linked SusC/RagA family outer membrane protein
MRRASTMTISSVGRLSGALVVAAMLVGRAAPAAAQRGTITGRVTDQASGQPLVGARVSVLGTALVAASRAEGRYVIPNVPPGQVTVRATFIGYAGASRGVTVGPGEAVTADVALKLTPYSLDEVVVTATGDQAKREIGNAIGRIAVESLVQTRPIANMNDLLSSKVPGVQVLQGNLTGAGARVRIRGTNSLSLRNEPVYMIDGIRMESSIGSSSIGIGGTLPSRLNDLNPEEMESLDVVKGPSASTLYGTDAANGVVVIRTKRGRPGPTQWSVYAEQGFVKDYNDYPIAYRGWRHSATDTSTAVNSRPANATQCFLTQTVRAQSDRQFCTQDSVTRYNLFEDPESSPNATGYRQQYGLQASGGTDLTRYFVSGEWENEVSQLKMPPFAVNRLLAARGLPDEDAIPFDQLRPNGRRRTSVRANIQTSLNPRVDLSVSTGFVSSTQRLPQTDNNTIGLLSNGLGGPGNKNNGRNGFRLYTPDQFFSETVTQDINRFIGSGTATWRPASWLAARATGGIDFTSRLDTDLCRRNQCAPIDSETVWGYKEDNRTTFFQYTADASATATFRLTATLTSRTVAGVQYFKNLFARNGAYSYNLPPGATTVTAGATPSADESTVESRTLGVFVEHQFGYKDRLYVTGALRADDNSAFGANFKAVYYPKLSVSYVISEEPFFPTWSWLNSVRLRGAIGASGVQPGTTDAVRYFSPTPASVDNADVAALVFTALGNPDLKPERAREYEIGGEAVLFDNRLSVDLTYYNKRTKDALIARVVAPSVGVDTLRFENLGAVVNRGIEALVNARLVDKRMFAWDLGVGAAYNTNFIADMGGVPPIITNSTLTRQRQGYPINAWWARPYTFQDTDGNGIISCATPATCEITVADSAAFVGYPNPRWEVNYTTGFDLFDKRLRIVGLFDHRSGYYQLNGTERIRCQSRNNCRGLIDPTAPLWEQARVVALRETGTTDQYGFIEKATFIRLREASATYDLPEAWARAFRAKRASFTVAGRNIWKGTGWTGMDPDANYFDTDPGPGVVSNFQTAPPPTYWTFRLNVGF